MAASYILRLLCLMLCCLGLLLVAFEILLWTSAPLLLRFLRPLSARLQERALYLVQLAPAVLSVGMTSFLLLPGYLRHETNFARERVGWFCLLIMVATIVWFGTSAAMGFRLLWRTRHFARACRRSGEGIGRSSDGVPVMAFTAQPQRLALIGLVRPFILVSRGLVGEEGLSPEALDVVLEHERAHARHGDNWKMLTLRSLPRLSLRLRGVTTWLRLWQPSAECAADDDAVRGDGLRAILLAETLVAFGRGSEGGGSNVVCASLVSGETDLVLRVERLLARPERGESVRWHRLLPIGLGLASIAAGLLLTGIAPMLGDLAERLLHLG